MKEIFKNIKSGIIIFLTFALCSGIYASWNSISKVNSGDKLTSSDWNKILDNMDYLSGRVEGGTLVSPGAVVAFNLQECPSGRKPANGTGGTVDLRGKFIRGLNSFESGQNKLTGDDSDVDGVSRALGSYQEDAIKNITGNYGMGRSDVAVKGAIFANSSSTYRVTSVDRAYASAIGFDASKAPGVTVGADNRPKNIGLIYCEKK